MGKETDDQRIDASKHEEDRPTDIDWKMVNLAAAAGAALIDMAKHGTPIDMGEIVVRADAPPDKGQNSENPE